MAQAVVQTEVELEQMMEVEAAHAAFCATMRALFDEHKKDYVAMGADRAWLDKTLKFEDER